MKKIILIVAGMLATLPISAYVAASKAKILIDKNDASVVNVAAVALSNDIRMVLGQGSNVVRGGQEKTSSCTVEWCSLGCHFRVK